MGYTIKTDDFRYTEWQSRDTGEVKARELYNHRKDAAENVNAAGRHSLYRNSERTRESNRKRLGSRESIVVKTSMISITLQANFLQCLGFDGRRADSL